MKRRGFLKSLIAVPAAGKALVTDAAENPLISEPEIEHPPLKTRTFVSGTCTCMSFIDDSTMVSMGSYVRKL